MHLHLGQVDTGFHAAECVPAVGKAFRTVEVASNEIIPKTQGLVYFSPLPGKKWNKWQQQINYFFNQCPWFFQALLSLPPSLWHHVSQARCSPLAANKPGAGPSGQVSGQLWIKTLGHAFRERDEAKSVPRDCALHPRFPFYFFNLDCPYQSKVYREALLGPCFY